MLRRKMGAWRLGAAVGCAVAAAALLTPFGLLAQGQRYRYDPTWPADGGRGAPDYRRDEVTGVATDAAGRVYVSTPTRHPILVFDREGRFIRSFGAGLLFLPHAVRVDPDGNVWVADINVHQVLKFSPEGALLGRFGVFRRRGWDASRFNSPTDIAFGPNGEAYVSDGYGNSRIVRLSRDGRYLGEWGSHGTGPGQFRLPHAVAVDRQGRVYVADRENRRIQVFTADGQFLSLMPLPDKPYGLHVTPDDRLFVAFERSDLVAVYDLAGTEIARLESPPRNPPPRRRRARRSRTRYPGEVAAPHMVCVDDHGAVYTAELRGHRAQRFLPE
jgi:DNA-binding beta-propeller fold protein YncE